MTDIIGMIEIEADMRDTQSPMGNTTVIDRVDTVRKRQRRMDKLSNRLD